MGYIGNKRSVNSQNAIDEGMLTFSQLKAWQKRAVKAGAVIHNEWHHTGKYFNETKYYDPEDFAELNPKDFPIVKEIKKEEPKKFFVLVSAEWGGTRKHPKIVGKEVKIVEKLTESQKNAKKYYMYGGSITEFGNMEEAQKYADQIER